MVRIAVILLLDGTHPRIPVLIEAIRDGCRQRRRTCCLQLHEIARHGPSNQYAQVIMALFMRK